MKILVVYAIKDLEKGKFATPFFVPEGTEEKEVVVDFKNYLQKGVMQLFLDPSNFELWYLGNFFLETGEFDGTNFDAEYGVVDNRKLVIAGSSLTGIKVPEDRKITVDLNDGKQN